VAGFDADTGDRDAASALIRHNFLKPVVYSLHKFKLAPTRAKFSKLRFGSRMSGAAYTQVSG
jgi:hypothetical protein